MKFVKLKMSHFALGCLLLSQFFPFSNPLKGQIIGLVVDSTRAPLPMVQIFDRGNQKLGQTRLDGYFRLSLKTGSYKLVFSHPDFHSTEIPIVVESLKSDTLNIILIPKIERMDGVTIRKDYKDPGPEYMRRAIEKRDFWYHKIPNQSAEIYIKAFEITESKFRRVVKAPNVDSDEGNDEPNKKDSVISGIATNANAFIEIAMRRDATTDGKIKETREGVTKLGNRTGLFYLSTTEGDFNLYQNLLNVPALCPLPIMSPLSNSALLAYRFRYISSYIHPQYGKILRIGMNGRGTANATLNGEIHLVDSSFWILKSELRFPKHLMAEYDAMVLEQYFQLDEQQHLLIDSMRFNYQAKAGKTLSKATTLVDYKKIIVVNEFPKNHFGMEVSKTTQAAYERDSAFWQLQRTLPLTVAETKFINRSDSIKRVQNSDVYLDSVEKKINTVSFKSLVLQGQGYKDRNKGITLRFQPLWNIYQPWWPGGARITMWNSFDKVFESKKSINFNENLSYGINNKDVRGTIYASHLYNPIKRSVIFVSVGKDFGVINQNAAYIDLFRRNNFYQNKHITVYHRRELINGLFMQIQGEFSQRKDLSKYQFDKFGDSLFTNNAPARFVDHSAFYSSLNLSYTPFQRYMTEPKQKVILGSAWPTFSINYKQALPNIFGSSIDYQYLEYRIEQSFPLGLLGTSEFRANSGSFLGKKNINLIDYRYQRRGDQTIFTPPMYAFQQLDTTFVTFKRFYEVHYMHNFNGSLINKIPFLKKASLYEKAGVNLLYAPERRNMFYYEGYVGIDKLVRLWRDRFKIGIYYTAGYSNLYDKPRTGFKINFEYYDRLNNKW